MPVQSKRLTELQDKAAELRAQLQNIAAEIEAEEASIYGSASPSASTAEPHLHHRPSYSILGGCEGAEEAPQPLRVLDETDKDFEAVLKDHPVLEVGPIGSYNHWDRRECAVQNADAWRERCARHIKDLGGKADIPKVIHQIWIGPREPPCLWIDTFRVEYCAEHPAWSFEMWDDAQVAKLPMINEEIYTNEKMWQCKADILRLEFLWHHGGLYVDADMISVGNKSLDPIIEMGKETGFVIAYEPDTKDKPYSILGNSVIACTPHHPLILMLILFLKQTFYHKRNHIDVFAVTGPVMYTKCLVDCNMPISLAPQELLYPAFHFVPNPDAIDFSRFPKCLMFQFGYTCSGLEGYVKSKNRCKKARICSFHSKKEWPFGKFKELPTISNVEMDFVAAGKPKIPKVIHQLVLSGVDSSGDPLRWRQSWWDGFKRAHPEFQYKTWTKDELSGRKWFCANLYIEPFDDQAVTELMLEVLFEEGGYYVPLTSLFTGNGKDAFFSDEDGLDFKEGSGGVMGAAKGSPGCFKKIQKIYDVGAVAPMPTCEPCGPRVLTMGFRDGLISQANFKPETKFLGCESIAMFAPGAGDTRLELAAINWAYECQVVCHSAKGVDGMKAAVSEGGIQSKCLFLCDRELLQLNRLRDELPGLIQQLHQEHHNWDLMFLGIEWNTGSDEVVLFKVPPGGRPQNGKVVGFLANLAHSPNKANLQRTLASCVTKDGFEPTNLFNAAGSLNIYFGAEKYPSSIEEARIWRSMPLVHRCFNELAGHYPPTDCDRHELHGNLMKGHQWDRLRFEMVLEPQGGIMFRCWNDDNSTNCEMKTNGTAVEWMKVYNNHQVCCEIQQKPIP